MEEGQLKEEIFELAAFADRALNGTVERKAEAEAGLDGLREQYREALFRRSLDLKGAAEEARKIRERMRDLEVLIEECGIAGEAMETYCAKCGALCARLRHLDPKRRALASAREKLEEDPEDPTYRADVEEWEESYNDKLEELSRRLEELKFK